tara:strand:- start:1652 stop:2311 length:660 start_codon:yes stop_codon:yes gene_type:complete
MKLNKYFKIFKIILVFIMFVLSILMIFTISKKNNFDDRLIYIDDFLSVNDYNKILNNTNKIRDLKNENFRLIKPLNNNQNKDVYDIFYSQDCLNKIKKVLHNNNVMKSDFPIEYRIYPTKSDGMKWHSDTLLYELPQYEVIYTIKNDSDSKTKWIDSNSNHNSVWTKPNSLLIVKAKGFKHMVTPINKGTRTILKLIYTQTDKTNNNYNNEMLRFKNIR